MSKPLKTIGKVAGVVAGIALIGTGIGAALGGTMVLAGIGSAATIASVAGAIAGVANMLSTATAKPPPARGSVTQLIVDPNAPQPYVMGESYFAGVLRHRAGYGGTVDGVVNPYLFDVVVYSGGGPVNSISPRVDLAAVSSWYSGFLSTDTQLGACPESTALSAAYGSPTGWGSSYKLSGQAAIGWNFKFDKKGKVYASGAPTTGALVQGVKVYDPRLDSTFPGGSGSHRLGNESTYGYSANPALHAGTYAYGRYQNGKRTFGIGLPADAIDWDVIAAWANVCDANGWTISGIAFEPANRWENLKEICFAGSADPIPGPVLSFRYDAPAVALDTVTEKDIADEAMSVVAMQSYRDRINVVKPKRRSPAHNWEMVQDAEVSIEAYVDEDGEERAVEWPFNFVKDKDQAAQLAAYKLVNARELQPIELVCMPRLRAYRPGDCLHLDLPQLGLDTDAIVLRREIEPSTMKVRLTLIGETPEKHAYALGLTGTAPPTPTLIQTSQERDETAAGAAASVQIDVVRVRDYAADSSGAVTSVLPDYIVPAVTLNGSDIRTSDTVSYAITPIGVSATINDTPADPDKGTIEVTEVAALNGWIDLDVEVGGVAQPTIRIATRKNVGLPTGLGGSGSKVASDSSFPAISSTSFVDVTDVMTVTLGIGGKIVATAPLDYGPNGTLPVVRTMTAKWQYSPAGAGTWTDFDTGEIVGSASLGGYGYIAGSGLFNDEATGLSAGDYDVKLVAKLDAATINVGIWGTATVSVTA